jgi:hypothetical protein
MGTDGPWLDERRGEVPIAWGVPPIAVNMFPALLEYYQNTATANDTFFAGACGAGYTWLKFMPNIPDFASYTEPLLQATGLQTVEIWGPEFVSPLETYKDYAPSVAMFTCERTDGGVNTWLSDGTPVTSSETSLWYPGCSTSEIVSRIQNFAATKSPPYFITVYDLAENIIDYANFCKDNLGSEFVIVGVEDFIDLMKQASP